MRIASRVITEILPFEPVAVSVFVGIFVEMRHFGPRAPTGDHLDQLITTEMGLVQIGGAAGRSGIAAAVGIDAMTKLTVRLVLEQTLPERGILCKGRIKRLQKDRSP